MLTSIDGAKLSRAKYLLWEYLVKETDVLKWRRKIFTINYTFHHNYFPEQ